MPKGSVAILVLLLFSFRGFGQTTQKVSVYIILKQLSEQHKIKFSWIDDDRVAYILEPPAKNLSLEDKLSYIELHTGLRFERISPGYYVIHNPAKTNKFLCGYVLDPATQKGIENVLVAISGKYTVGTDSNGYFELPGESADSIAISHIAYKPKIMSSSLISGGDCPKIYLEEAAIPLKEVIAERYLASGISKKSSGELLIRPQKFGLLPGLTEPDILQTMQQVPGIMSVDETVSNVSVRGGTHDQNLFLWNGIRIFQTSHFFGLISAFNPLQHTTITMYKNGSPVFYGESVSSVADISTHGNDINKNTVATDLVSAGFLTAVQPTEKSKLAISGRRSYSDIWVSPTFRNYRERIFQNTVISEVADDTEVPISTTEKFYFYDASLSYQVKLNDGHSLMVDGIILEDNLDVYQKSQSSRNNSSLRQQTFGGTAKLVSKWNEKTQTEVQGYVSLYDVDAVYEAVENGQWSYQANRIFDKGVRLNYNYDIFPELKLNAGYQFNEVGVRNSDGVNIPEFSNTEKVALISHAMTGQASYTSKNNKTKLYAGLRTSYFEKFGLWRAEPRMVFNQSLLPGLRVEIIGEKKSQAVSQKIDLQQDFLGIEKRRWVLADEKNIPVQKSSQVSTGINYSKNNWFASVEGFYKEVDGIASSSQNFRNQFEFSESTGSYSVLGYEVLVQKKVSNFYSWVSYTFNDSDYHFKDFVPKEFANNFKISHSATFAVIYEWDSLKFALGGKWRTGIPVTTPLSFIIDPDNPSNSEILYNLPNNTRSEDYLQVNFSASKSWKFSEETSFSAGCSLLNIFDRQNVTGRYYRINKKNNSPESISTYGLGITPNISLKMMF